MKSPAPAAALVLAAPAWLAASLAVPGVAHACGAAYPGGPVMCDDPHGTRARAAAAGANGAGDPNDKPRYPVARVVASWAYTSTTISFEGRHSDLTRHTVFGGAEIPLPGASSLHFGMGGIADGDLGYDDARGTHLHASMGPGLAGYVGLADRLFDAHGWWPFLQLTATLSATHAITHAAADRPYFDAFDLRVGALLGKTFADVFTGYFVARAFGGPVYWRYAGDDLTGTDLYKYQLGLGLSLSLARHRVDLFVEYVPFGESGVAAGLGTTFF